MRSRQEIKEYAKQAFNAQRTDSILASFLPGLVTGGLTLLMLVPTLTQTFSMLTNPRLWTDPYYIPVYQTSALSVMTSWLSIPISLFTMVLMINMAGFFVKVYYGQKAVFSEPFTAFKYNFGRKLGGSCWEALWLTLWTLVGIFSFYIPLIIKFLSYSQTQYILASNPNVTATNALKLSMRMTKGHKGKVFVMYLSFIGWQILNSFTFGILGIFYVNPYMNTAFAGMFVELRNTAVANGVIHPAELDGVSHQYVQQYQQYPQYPPSAPGPYMPQQQYMQQPQYPQQTQYPPQPGQPYPQPGQPYSQQQFQPAPYDAPQSQYHQPAPPQYQQQSPYHTAPPPMQPPPPVYSPPPMQPPPPPTSATPFERPLQQHIQQPPEPQQPAPPEPQQPAPPEPPQNN